MTRRPTERPDGLAGSYQPSMLVVDVMAVLLQRGVQAVLRSADAAQAHQAAWTLLDVLGVTPDTSRCACAACGGAALILSPMDLVVGNDQPNPADLPRLLLVSDVDAPPEPSDENTPRK